MVNVPYKTMCVGTEIIKLNEVIELTSAIFSNPLMLEHNPMKHLTYKFLIPLAFLLVISNVNDGPSLDRFGSKVTLL